MKWLKVFCLALCLMGCQHHQTYSIGEWLESLVEQLSYQDDSIMTHWQQLLQDKSLEEPLCITDTILVLNDILDGDDKDFLVAMGLYEKEEITTDNFVSKERAMRLNDKLLEILENEVFSQPKTDATFKPGIIQTDDLDQEHTPGIYETPDGYYVIEDDGTIREARFDEIIAELDIETTFSPDLSESIILPEDAMIQEGEVVEQSYLPTTNTLLPISRRHFSFRLNDYQVHGQVWSRGVSVQIKKRTDEGYVLTNDLMLSNLAIHSNVNLKQENEPHFYFRADYDIEDRFSVAKEHKQNFTTKKLDVATLTTLTEQLATLVDQHPKIQNTLDLFKFDIPVPGTLNTLKVQMALQLQLLVNGEASVTLACKQHQGYQNTSSFLHEIQQKEWSLTPYIDGSTELLCNLDFDLCLGQFLIADSFAQSGFGAEGTATMHYVDTQKKAVNKTSMQASLSQIAEVLDDYEDSKEAYIDTCLDANVYWLCRLGVGGNQRSLLRKLGIYASFVPIKEQKGLFHIEDHQIVSECTRQYDFEDWQELKDQLQLSSYQVILKPNETFLLTAVCDEPLTWFSNDSTIASVKDGCITAHQIGSTMVQVKSESGQSNSCVVIVIDGYD